MNKCIFVGNLTKDFQINDKGVARSSMALDAGVDKDGNPRPADFPSLVAFGRPAEVLAEYGKKGKRFAFECRVNTGSYEKDGQRIYTTDFIIDRFEFCDRKSDQEAPATAEAPSEWANIPDGIEEELPFN